MNIALYFLLGTCIGMLIALKKQVKLKFYNKNGFILIVQDLIHKNQIEIHGNKDRKMTKKETIEFLRSLKQ